MCIVFIVSPEGSGAISPLDVVACLNDDVTLICTAMGGPNTTFQWKMNGTIVGNDSTLTLAAIDASYGGNYTCTMSNAAGTDSASTTIYIAPYIVTPLEKQTLAFNGTDVIIFCNAAGFPTPTVSWVNAMGLEVSSTSLLQSNPTIFGLEGVYRCVAKTEINRSTFNITDETIFIGN